MHAFFAGGAGGQVVMVIREPDLVVAIYAGKLQQQGHDPHLARAHSQLHPAGL